MKALREIVRTCSNAHVARAAVASIGGDFAEKFAEDASRHDLPSGVFAARIVRDFANSAGQEEWDGVSEATRGSDQPILSGLRYILDRRPNMQDDANEDGTPPAWAIHASRAACHRR
ncbi:MAG: hypothetical protein JO107_00300 [Hyphomicrobiales bacterium]|nr:hypothetical protein [Hyphomicrobiales bacterium]MBV8661515.1 hypothetical protein [Hyphomicrobiales bacterium]